MRARARFEAMLTYVRLPKVNESPVEPDLCLAIVHQRECRIECLRARSRAGQDPRVRPDGFDALVFPHAVHACNEHVRAQSSEDRVDRSPDTSPHTHTVIKNANPHRQTYVSCNFAWFAIELIAHAEEKGTQARHDDVDLARLVQLVDENAEPACLQEFAYRTRVLPQPLCEQREVSADDTMLPASREALIPHASAAGKRGRGAP